MEKQNSSPHPGGGNLSDWIVKPYSIMFAGVVLFILIFGIAFFLGWRQLNDTRNNVLASDKTIANLLADVILQHNRTTIGILQSYAHRPLFIAAVEKKDLAGIDRRLSDLKKNAGIDTSFVTDKSGILLTNLPVFPESRGKDFSQRDWYKGISAHWKPYISSVFKQIVGDKQLAVAICVPIFDEKERPIGILGNSQRLNYIEDTIEKVPFNPYTTVSVIDQDGKILYSNRYSYRETIAEYPHLPILDRAMKDMRQQIEDTRHKDLGELYLTVVPIGDIGWTAVIERSLRGIYHSALSGFIEIGAISFLLFLLLIVLLVYLRKVTLFKKTEELLQAETKLRQRDEELRALSSRQEAILAAVPAIIMEVDDNKIYTWANSVGIEFFGEDVIGKEAVFYFEGEQDTYEMVRPLFNGGEEIIYVESWQRRRDGQKRLLAWSCRVLKNEKGNVEGALSSAYDITERKRAEEQILRQSKLLAAINRVFFETLTADREEEVAKTCLKVSQELTDSQFGFIGEITPESLFTITALTDPGWETCRIPETQASVLIKDMVIRGIWGQVILKEQSLIVNDPVSYPDRVGIPEGHPPLSSFLGVPLKDQGKVTGMIALANRESGYTSDHQQDMEAISVAFVEAIRRKQAEEKIIQLNVELEQRVIDRTAQLEAANKELEAFSYSVSHDLRAPLRSIDGFSQALIEEYQGKLDDTGKGYLERVRKATLRMGLLIDDLLRLSRINRAELKHESFDLSGLIQTIADANQKNNLDRVVDVTIQESIMVEGDPNLMQIALVNLLDNAFKFTGKESHPRIEFGRTIKEGKTAYYVRDNGAGFDMAYVGKLFGVFQRLHTKEEFAGTGIGLATVQRIINRHGGQVWAEGEVGKGATFYFTLPS